MSLQNNNNNDKNRKEKKSLYEILDKQGFYFILFLCVCIVAGTALWVNRQQEDPFIGEEPSIPFEEEREPEVTLVEKDKQDEQAQTTGRIGEGKPKDGAAPQTPKEEKQEKPAETEETAVEEKKIPDKDEEKEKGKTTMADQGMAVPVIGKLGLPFADDHLVYHKTLDQWSTHKGIDIHAQEGTPVRAVLDGEVVEVVNDTIMGITITLRHDGDLLTRYSNLSTDAMVKIGEKVKKGQTISGVGRTASNKAEEGPLLHFQVLKDDKFVDPQNYLGRLNK